MPPGQADPVDGHVLHDASCECTDTAKAEKALLMSFAPHLGQAAGASFLFLMSASKLALHLLQLYS